MTDQATDVVSQEEMDDENPDTLVGQDPELDEQNIDDGLGLDIDSFEEEKG